MIAVGQTIGNYMLTAKLGEGGMGVVYLAEHPVIGRKVAMKAIHPELSRNPEVVSRFVTEAKSVNQIGNEHIVDIHDFGTTGDGEFYFIMEFLQGEALSDRLKRAAPFDPALASAIAAQVADALGASHQHGIIHRDLKPENIFLITKGHATDFVKVLDFGLAKLTQGDEKVSHKTRTGSVMGTPYYMSPEQCEGRPNIDHRADIYSLGVILFEMLTAKVPFGGEGYGEIIVKHLTAPVPPPRAINPLLSPALETIVLRALAKRREDRFQTMEAFAEALIDPERYAATAPAVAANAPVTSPTAMMDSVGASPLARADSVVSGQVLFGQERSPSPQPERSPSQHELGGKAAAMPSTFRHAVGEVDSSLDDEAFEQPRRRRGAIVAGLLGAVTLAALAAYLFTGSPSETAPEPTATTVVHPKKVRLSFKSDPAGAAVVRKDTNQQIGVTPFTFEIAASDAAIDFAFRKESFREKVESYVPSESGMIAVALVADPVAPADTPEAKADTDAEPKAEAKPKREKRRRAARRTHTLDEDGVLAPSF